MTPNSRMHSFSLSRNPHGVLMAGGFALTCLLSNPAKAGDQYCSFPSPHQLNKCPVAAGFNTSTDTYFWSPISQPSSSGIDLTKTPFLNKVKKLTLRGSSNVMINATGNPTKAEVLIGSLGTNRFVGGNSVNVGPDTFVVGNPPASVTCTTSGANCRVNGNPGAENDNITLSSTNGVLIYIDRCLQMTAPYKAGESGPTGEPGKGGLSIATANKANTSLSEPNYQPITDVAGTCPVASIGLHDLQTTALRGRDALLTPWERWWSATGSWNRGLHWLQQAMIALIQGPYAQAAESPGTAQWQNSPAPPRVATYDGVTRVIQNDPQANFLRKDKESGSTIVVNAGTHPFNRQTLVPNRGNSTVYKQYGMEPIPLGKGIVFVYHEPLGILAAYSNDRYSYGSERNRGSVIAQLVRGDGSALPARSIDYVVLNNLNASEGSTPTKPTTMGNPKLKS